MRKLVFTLGFIALTSGPVLAGEQEARIEVSGLCCPSCSFIVGEALQKSTSVEIISYVPSDTGETAVYTVTFDDTITTVEEIAAQPSEYGYSAVVLTVGASNS